MSSESETETETEETEAAPGEAAPDDARDRDAAAPDDAAPDAEEVEAKQASEPKKKKKKKKPRSVQAAGVPEPSAQTPKKGPIDALMRGIVMVALGAFVTTPLWCQDQQTQNFRPTQFRADRSDENSMEGQLSDVIRGVIEKAVRDEEVDEVESMRQLSTILADGDLGTPESRADSVDQLIGDIVAQAAETSGMGFGQMQDQAIRGQARVMARSLITQLGGNLGDSDEDAPEGEWEPAAWPILSNFEYEEGMELPARVKAFDEKNVMAWGYLLYLEDDQFLLVQSLWSCCFGRPPDLHEAIVVRADPSIRRLEGRGVRVYGRFEAGEMREDGYVTSLYRLDSVAVRPM